MKLAVGFITYNETSAKYLADFLPSLETALQFLALDDYQIYAWDNSSPTDERNRLALEAFNKSLSQSTVLRRPLKYLTAGKNLGFSRAYNILINLAIQAGARYFLAVNPDTVLEPNAVAELVKALDEDHGLGSAAPKILRWDFVNRAKTKIIDSAGLILKPGLRFLDLGQGLEDKNQFDQAKILGPSGAAGLFRLRALSKIAASGQPGQAPQYFDEHFFMYKEDCDLAYRLFLAGYESCLVPTSRIYHDRAAASLGPELWRLISDRRKKNRQIRSWSFRNQHLIFVKHWEKQNFVNRLFIIFYCLAFLIFSLILEQFLLKQYYFIIKYCRPLTNIK